MNKLKAPGSLPEFAKNCPPSGTRKLDLASLASASATAQNGQSPRLLPKRRPRRPTGQREWRDWWSKSGHTDGSMETAWNPKEPETNDMAIENLYIVSEVLLYDLGSGCVTSEFRSNSSVSTELHQKVSRIGN